MAASRWWRMDGGEQTAASRWCRMGGKRADGGEWMAVSGWQGTDGGEYVAASRWRRATPLCWWYGYRTQTQDHLLKDGRCSWAVLDFLSSSMHLYWIMAILFTMGELGRA